MSFQNFSLPSFLQTFADFFGPPGFNSRQLLLYVFVSLHSLPLRLVSLFYLCSIQFSWSFISFCIFYFEFPAQMRRLAENEPNFVKCVVFPRFNTQMWKCISAKPQNITVIEIYANLNGYQHCNKTKCKLILVMDRFFSSLISKMFHVYVASSHHHLSSPYIYVHRMQKFYRKKN